MTILRIRTQGDPVLRTPALTVTDFDESLRTLISDMFETMYAVKGVGLAAPQVGVGLQIFTWDIGDDSGHVINPSIEVGDEPQEGGEGCLSVPGPGYDTPRANHAIITGVDMNGEPVRREGTGLLARCFQHETDHLHGTLFVDRLEGEVRKEAMRAMRAPEYQDIVDTVTRERETQRLGASADATSATKSSLRSNAFQGANTRSGSATSGSKDSVGSSFTGSSFRGSPTGSSFTGSAFNRGKDS
ncbi:peptide deformylase [Kocuria sp. WRN011]|uniref:Peptide deformylase n=1 Tax=Kocuria carniphila TaxID=262208 RepID=A0ABV3UZE1_9MICC|nr:MULTISPECIES: peptide deformylase [Kocuria]PBB07851.1 peptide deformylase [Kocuria sp. WRN011]